MLMLSSSMTGGRILNQISFNDGSRVIMSMPWMTAQKAARYRTAPKAMPIRSLRMMFHAYNPMPHRITAEKKKGTLKGV